MARQTGGVLEDACRLCGSEGTEPVSKLCRCPRKAHKACMERQLTSLQTDRCKDCGFQFVVQRRHRHGLLGAARRSFREQQSGGQLAVSLLWALVVTPVAVLSGYFVQQSLAYYHKTVAIRQTSEFWARTVRQPTLANRVFVVSVLVLAGYGVSFICLLVYNLWHFFTWRRRTRLITIVQPIADQDAPKMAAD